MRDPERIKRILGNVQRIWEANPDLRLAQLLANALRMADVPEGSAGNYFYAEDDKLEEGLEQLERALAPE